MSQSSTPSVKPNGPASVREYLRAISGLHERLIRPLGPDELRICAEHHLYPRLQGGGVRPVSLHPGQPLGKVRAGGRVVGEFTTLDGLRKRLAELKAQNPASSFSPKPDDEVGEERKLQSWLIRQAMLQGRSFHRQIEGLSAQGLDDLVFVCDEISVSARMRAAQEASKGIRCDVIGLGRRGGTWFPVFIELKFKRELGTLIDQLESIQHEMLAESVAPAFRTLLATVAGLASESDIDLAAARKMLIWPDGNESDQTRDRRISKQLICVHYTPLGSAFHLKVHG